MNFELYLFQQSEDMHKYMHTEFVNNEHNFVHVSQHEIIPNQPTQFATKKFTHVSSRPNMPVTATCLGLYRLKREHTNVLLQHP